MIIFLSFLTIIVNWKETVFPFILTQCHVIFLRTECKKKISLWRWNFTTTQKWSFRVWGLWKRKRSVTKYRRNFCHQQWRFRYMVYTVSSSIILDKIERTKDGSSSTFFMLLFPITMNKWKKCFIQTDIQLFANLLQNFKVIIKNIYFLLVFVN